MSVVQVKKTGLVILRRTVVHGLEGHSSGKRLDYPQHLDDPQHLGNFQKDLPTKDK